MGSFRVLASGVLLAFGAAGSVLSLSAGAAEKSVAGVAVGDPEGKVREAWGEPTGTMEMGGRKTLMYPGRSVIIDGGRVEGFMGVSDTRAAPPRKAKAPEVAAAPAAAGKASGGAEDIGGVIEQIQTLKGVARARAVDRCVGEWAAPAVPTLVGLLEDATPFEAIPAMGGMRTGYANTTMGQIAADALGTIGMAAWPPCMERLEAGTPFGRANAAVALQALWVRFNAQDLTFPGRLIEAFESGAVEADPEAKARMARVLEKVELPAALEALHRSLGHSDKYFVATVLEILGRRRDAASIPALAGVFLGHPDAYCREAAGAALLAFEDPAAGRAVEAGAGRPDAKTRQGVAEILGQSKEEGFVPTLARMLKDRDAGVRRMAVRSLCRIGGASVTMPLVWVALDDPEGIVAQDAFNYLAGSGAVQTNRDPALVAALLPGLKMRDARRRAWFAELVGRTGAAEGYEELARLAGEDPEAEVRRCAVAWLDSFEDPGRKAVILKCLMDDASPQVRQAAMQAVKYGSLWGSQEEILLRLLREGRGERAEEAAFTMAELHLVRRNPEALSVFVRCLTREDPRVRARAEEVLCDEAGIPRYGARGKEFGGDPDRWRAWWREQGIAVR